MTEEFSLFLYRMSFDLLNGIQTMEKKFMSGQLGKDESVLVNFD